jgi:uroporphyrin-III C-methyltransferase
MSDLADNASASPPPASRVAFLRTLAWPLVILLIALALLWQWYDSRADYASLREEIARRLRDSDNDSRDARLAARQAQEAARETQARLAQLEAKLAESQSQQLALETLYQELSRGRDEWALAEIEQILTIASQQLQLAGNVQAALLALQTADARLARADRPQFIPLRKVLARDIERLKNAPNVDLVGLTLRLDQVIASVDSMPLAWDRLYATSAGEPPPAEGFWSRLGSGMWTELKQLVRVRNLERPEPPLLSPTQEFFLRENLRLRLLNARLALLERNETVFRSDVQAAAGWISRYFDTSAKQVASTSASLKHLSSSGISFEIPGIGESLAAVRNIKAVRDKSAR